MTKTDKEESELFEQFINPYEYGTPIVTSGRVIDPKNVTRLYVTKSDRPFSDMVAQVRINDRASRVVRLSAPPAAWRAFDFCTDVTDQYVTTSPGAKAVAVSTSPTGPSEAVKSATKVFIVHGHDDKLRLEASEFITSLSLEPVVLMNEPSEGLTVIEKFEKNADVGYAVILATPDDVAFLSSTYDAATDLGELGEPERRARQNVIFEWGYFAAKLGRKRVALVYKQPVVLPSDLGGLVYLGYKDSIEEIKMKLFKELKAAGIEAIV